MAEYPDWQRELEAALLETDSQKLPQRVMAVEDAIVARLQALANASDADAERSALEDAIKALRVIQIEKLGYPDWNKK